MKHCVLIFLVIVCWAVWFFYFFEKPDFSIQFPAGNRNISDEEIIQLSQNALMEYGVLNPVLFVEKSRGPVYKNELDSSRFYTLWKHETSTSKAFDYQVYLIVEDFNVSLRVWKAR
ncbi:MAG: hypothetical protein NTV80_08350 [Verrucomicrobia bacterium]|nr:hypothetical protein [Verrucomicrobiota bacterium]